MCGGKATIDSLNYLIHFFRGSFSSRMAVL